MVALALGVALWLSAAAGAAATPWSGSGTGTTSVVSNGTAGVAQFTYSDSEFCCASGSWTFSTVSNSSGSIPLDWSYSGYHAFFQVTVSLSAFVTHLGVTTTFPLVDDGPADCCTPPSGGFSYTGTTTLPVLAGDTYGFLMSGTNGDSDGRLIGTLTVVLPATPPAYVPPPPRASYCSAPGNSNPFTANPIPPGTFLDLLSNQPDTDPNYKGATPAIFVEGKGLTCDPPPSGHVQNGLAGDAQHVAAGIYPYYGPPS